MPPERVVVLPNTVSAAFEPGDSSALRMAWGLQDKRVLLTVGRMSALERYKGQDRVIKLLDYLTATLETVIEVVTGEVSGRCKLCITAVSGGCMKGRELDVTKAARPIHELPITVYVPQSPMKNPKVFLISMMADLVASRNLAWRLFVRDLSAQYRNSIL